MIWFTINKIAANLPPSLLKVINPEIFVKENLDKQTMKGVQDFAKLSIPKYLFEYASSQMMTWCINAVYALLYYKENENYVINNGEIVPVDYRNTGVWQRNMTWGDGLHQFLQMKHDLPVKQINLTTNFLSNVSFFRRYKSNIFGLSGTLGSESEQQLLRKLYTLNTINIPSYKIRKLKELEGVVSKDRKEWLDEITNRVIEKTKKGRAALVICETIANVEEIKRKRNFTIFF